MPSRKVAAGILPVRPHESGLEFFLVHPGGPYFRRRNDGIWSVPKGILEPTDHDALSAAKRELEEETGFSAPPGPYVELGFIRQKGGKVVHAWAVAAPAYDPAAVVSNTFELEWPPRSGKTQSFPEVDRAAWFGRDDAGARIVQAQTPLLDRALALRATILGE